MSLAGLSSAFAAKVKPDYELGKKKNTGLVILSTTITGLDKPLSSIILDLRYQTQKKPGSAFSAPTFRFNTGMWSAAPSEFPEDYGVLQVYELEPGEYEIYDVTLSYTAYNFRRGANDAKPSIRFRVQEGMATYIGNFDLKVKMTLAGTLFNVVSDDIQDKADRDIPLFMSRFQRVPAEKISISLMSQEALADSRPYVPVR